MTDAPKPKITAIAPWFGGKRTLASTIVEELGPHRAYFEPFCGSLAVLLAKPVAAMETVNDLHGELVNLARVLASPHWAHCLHERLMGTLCSEELYNEACNRASAPMDREVGDVLLNATDLRHWHMQRAYWFFILSWLGRNGTSGSVRTNFQMAVRWTPNGGSGGVRFVAAVDSIPAWHQRLRKVTILNRDAFEIIPRISDEKGVAIYVDPPYIRDSRSGKGGGSRYLHDFEDGDLLEADDHARLAEQLHQFKHARVVLSYYDHPRLEKLYPDWTKRSCAVSKQLALQNKRGAKRVDAPEVLLINGLSRKESPE